MLETENLRNVCVSDLPLPLPVSLAYFLHLLIALNFGQQAKLARYYLN